MRPAGAVCYLPWFARLDAAEHALDLALVAIVAGNRSGISAADVTRELSERFLLGLVDFSVHHRRDDEFLIRFRDAADHARVAARSVRAARFWLILNPWSRLAGARPVSLCISVDIEITGIPDHG